MKVLRQPLRTNVHVAYLRRIIREWLQFEGNISPFWKVSYTLYDGEEDGYIGGNLQTIIAFCYYLSPHIFVYYLLEPSYFWPYYTLYYIIIHIITLYY